MRQETATGVLPCLKRRFVKMQIDLYVYVYRKTESIKLAVQREKVLYSICAQRRLRSFCTSVQQDSSLFPQYNDPKTVGEFGEIWPVGV